MVDGNMVDFGKINGDHVEGEKALAATRRTKERTIVVSKNNKIHKAQTEARREIELEALYNRHTDSKGLVSWGFGRGKNRTYLSLGHTIHTYYDIQYSDSIESLKCVPDSCFNEIETRKDFQEIEPRAILAQKKRFIERMR